MKKHILIVVAVLALGGLIAQMHVATQSYQPVVRVQGPAGLSYTAVLDARRERTACGVASQQFIAPLKLDCPECRIIYARCRREGEGLPALAEQLHGGPGHSLVSMPGVTITIDGTPDLTSRTCEQIASSVQRWGIEGARCVAAAPDAPRS